MFKQEVLNTKTALAQSTILAMDASLVTVPHLYQVNGKTGPPGEKQGMIDKDWGYIWSRNPKTLRRSLNFYQYHFCTIQQTGGKVKREILEYVYIIGMW